MPEHIPATPTAPNSQTDLADVVTAEDPEPRLQVEVMIAAGDWSAAEPIDDAIGEIVRAISNWPGLLDRDAEATVCLSDDAEVSQLNAQFRGKPRPTNVLSFPADDVFGQMSADGDASLPPQQLGDVILAIETVAIEASDSNVEMRHHLQHLVLHGLLHLQGYDHQTGREAEVMESLETAILQSLGIADPYADAATTEFSAVESDSPERSS